MKRKFTQTKLMAVARILLVATLMCNLAYAQVINEGFEEAEWIAGTTTGTASLTQPTAIVTVNAAGTASINNGTWSYSNGVVVGTGSTGSNSTIVRNGLKGFWFGQTGGSFIITPLITSGIATVTFSAFPNGSSSTGIYVAVATNTSVTTGSASLLASNTGGSSGQWSGSGYASTLNTAYGFTSQNNWVTISFTTNIPAGQPAYLKIQRQSGGQFFIDDIVVTGPGAVPVNFSSVTATKKENAATIEWGVASQVNVKNYLLEESTDGTSFMELARIEAKKGQSTYTAVDINLAEINYYRIKAVDNDGSFKYSKTIVVNTKIKAELAVYPNPAVSSITVSHPPANEKATIQIISAEGKKLLSYTVNGNVTQSVVDVGKLTSGNYLLIYDDGKASITTKFIKQ